MVHIGLIGFGGIGRALHADFAGHPAVRMSVLTRSPVADAPEGLSVVHELADLLDTQPDVIVECAGHGAVHDHAAAVLRAGIPLVIASLGALADADLDRELRCVSKTRNADLIFPSGAIGGLDLLRAVSASGGTRVRYTGTKPPAAWRGSPAEAMIDLDHLAHATPFYEGDARDCARLFPKNANVVAALALAGPGFEAISVCLVADPTATGNRHAYQVDAPECRFEVTIDARPSASNARTSRTTMLSIAETVRARFRL